MPTLMDICSGKSGETINRLLDDVEKEKKEEWKKAEEEYRRKYVFDSYEQALDYLVEHEGSIIRWHARTLSWIPDEELFESHEQEYSLDGVIPYDVVRKYTRKELLDGIEQFIQKRGLTLGDLKGRFGTLDYVGIIRK